MLQENICLIKMNMNKILAFIISFILILVIIPMSFQVIYRSNQTVQVQVTSQITESVNIEPTNQSSEQLIKVFREETNTYDEVNLEDYIRMENDKGEMKRLEFRWFDLETLKDTRFLPEVLKEKLTSDVLENIITKD